MSLYKETLMNHFRNPKFKIANEGAKQTTDGVNPSCGDNITLYTDISDGVIKNISFTGSGCAISMASADILCEVITNTQNQKSTIDKFIDMINGNEEIVFKDNLKKLEVFNELQMYPARKSCALLPWKTLKSLL